MATVKETAAQALGWVSIVTRARESLDDILMWLVDGYWLLVYIVEGRTRP